jgi:hypothetical protein
MSLPSASIVISTGFECKTRETLGSAELQGQANHCGSHKADTQPCLGVALVVSAVGACGQHQRDTLFINRDDQTENKKNSILIIGFRKDITIS